MKKIVFVLLLMLFSLFLAPAVQAQEPVTDVYIHYYRYDGDYQNWNLWLWQAAPTSFAGDSFAFEDDDTATIFNFGGVVTKISLADKLTDATQLGLIVRRGEWIEKDIDNDRFINLPETIEDGILHIYLVESDMRIGYGPDDVNGPDKNPKFRMAYFRDMDEIYFNATEVLETAYITLYADGQIIVPEDITITDKTGVITLAEEIDFSKKYVLEATFSNNFINTYDVTYDGIYDSLAFEDAFGYEGNDLGAIVHDGKTTFRLWAPISNQVVLNLYQTGTPAYHGGADDKTEIIMTPAEKGTFYAEISDNLHGTYYTFSVTNGTSTFEVIDPYAKSSGINGIRGLVVDFTQTNPEGFVYGTRADNMTHPTDAIIYELHVRDLTTHESWNGTEANRGKLLGLIESGTRYQGVTTGFDHIVELGVTHIQLLPIYDFGVVDETRLEDADYNAFNWGYMPLNFNVLEGAYSSDPYDGLVRIMEMKQVVQAFTDVDIRIIMDVVYNHTGLTADSNFHMIVPGYYHRKTASGAFSNGSGTGNETASERFMMRKFIVESIVFWAQEYNLSGFRFDLMALHDLETMNAVVEALHALDDSILIYGEPWMGGSTPLPAEQQAGKQNLHQLDHVGAFNDDLRDAVKGSVFARSEGGFIQGMFTERNITRIKYGIVGGIAYPGLSGSLLSAQKIWHSSPVKTINYVTAHDNNTLHDKLYLTLEETGRLALIPALMKQANAIVLTAQGIPFLHAGDEFMRSKPKSDSPGDFDHNSYESPDTVNQLRWDEKATPIGQEMFAYYQGLIALRKTYDVFRMTDPDDIMAYLAFLHEGIAGLIAFTIAMPQDEQHPNLLVIHHANARTTRLKLPTGGGWHVLVDGTSAGTETLRTYKGGQTIRLDAHATYVLVQDVSILDIDNTALIIGITIGSLGLAGAGFVLVRFLMKRKTPGILA